MNKTLSELRDAFLDNEISEEELLVFLDDQSILAYFDKVRNENIVTVIADFKSLKVLEFVLSKKFDPNLPSGGQNRTPIFDFNYDLDYIKLLFRYGANLNHLDIYEYNFLMFGTNYDVLEFCLQNGFNAKHETTLGQNLLFTLFDVNYHSEQAKKEQLKILNLCLELNLFDLNSPTKSHLNILQYALIKGDLPFDCLKALLTKGANPKIPTIIPTERNRNRYVWGDPILLNRGLSFIDILNEMLLHLDLANKKGLIPERLYYEQGREHLQIMLDIVQKY